MGPTETRSRDEWLAEVRRRGTQIRRRRRVGVSVVGALALVLPVSVMATVLSGGPERAVEVSVAGPAPAGGMAPLPAPPNELATGEVPPVAATPEVAPTTTVAEVHERVAIVNGVPGPRSSPTSVPTADDPVVRPAPTTTSASGNTSSPALPPTPTSAPPASTAPCAGSEAPVTVSTEKTVYRPGETVRGASTLENRSAASCLLPTRGFFKVLNAGGKVVGSFAYTADFRFPVTAEPGKTFTSTFSWDQLDCSGPACVQVPAGAYTAVAEWTESGPYTGSTTFQITG